MPLFAAWRAMPAPDDAPGARAAVFLHLLREHFGGAQLLATRASGLSPLEAILCRAGGRGGRAGVRLVAAVPAVRTAAAAPAVGGVVTDRIASTAFAVLTGSNGGNWSTCWRAPWSGCAAARPPGG